MKKRKILAGLIVFAALTISGILLASSPGADAKTCDEKVNTVCESAQGEFCYFYLKGGGSGARSDSDRCWYDDHKFRNDAQ